LGLSTCFWCERAVLPPGFRTEPRVRWSRSPGDHRSWAHTVPGVWSGQPRPARIEGCSGHYVSDATGAASRSGMDRPGIGNAESHTGRRLVGCFCRIHRCSAKRPCQGRSTLCASHPGFDKSANIEGGSNVRPWPRTVTPHRAHHPTAVTHRPAPADRLPLGRAWRRVLRGLG